jgi:hypothetical protein
MNSVKSGGTFRYKRHGRSSLLFTKVTDEALYWHESLELQASFKLCFEILF